MSARACLAMFLFVGLLGVVQIHYLDSILISDWISTSSSEIVNSKSPGQGETGSSKSEEYTSPVIMVPRETSTSAPTADSVTSSELAEVGRKILREDKTAIATPIGESVTGKIAENVHETSGWYLDNKGNKTAFWVDFEKMYDDDVANGKIASDSDKAKHAWLAPRRRLRWNEFNCFGYNETGNLAHKTIFETIPEKARCGCLMIPQAEEVVEQKKKTCRERKIPRPAKCKTDPNRPLWIQFVGDSTVHQLSKTVRLAAIIPRLKDQMFDCKLAFEDKYRSTRSFAYAKRHPIYERLKKDGEAVTMNVFDDPNDIDFDVVCTHPKLTTILLSFRRLHQFSLSKFIAYMKRPHYHHHLPPPQSSTDDPHFVEIPWDVRFVLPNHKDIAECGPDIFIPAVAAWEDAGFVGGFRRDSLESATCGAAAPLIKNFTVKAYPGRLNEIFSTSCELYGPGRFVWRMANLGKDNNFTTIKHLNKIARNVALGFAHPVLDVEKLHNYYSNLRYDKIHVSSVINLRALKNVFLYLAEKSEEVTAGQKASARFILENLNFELHLHHQTKQSYPYSLAGFLGVYKTFTPEEFARFEDDRSTYESEDAGTAPWSIRLPSTDVIPPPFVPVAGKS